MKFLQYLSSKQNIQCQWVSAIKLNIMKKSLAPTTVQQTAILATVYSAIIVLTSHPDKCGYIKTVLSSLLWKHYRVTGLMLTLRKQHSKGRESISCSIIPLETIQTNLPHPIVPNGQLPTELTLTFDFLKLYIFLIFNEHFQSKRLTSHLQIVLY